MFRNLIPALADKFHLIAPDYPGYGASSMPLLEDFEYSFDNITNIIEKFVTQMGIKIFKKRNRARTINRIIRSN